MFDFKTLNNTDNAESSLTPRVRATLANLVDGKCYHIDHFGFDKGKFGEYAYFYVVEDKEHTYYASKPITRKLREIFDANAGAELHNHPVVFEKHTVKIGDNIRKYVDILFI